MLERRDAEQVFSAPFVSAPLRVEPAWIDYNGHLNMAYYNVLFDRAVDEVYELLGCGLAYLKEPRHSCFTAEVHVRYLRELHAGDAVRVTFQLLEFRQAAALLRGAAPCRGGLAVGDVGEHGAARRYDGAKGRAVSSSNRGAACAHEGGTRRLADSRRRRPAYHHAGTVTDCRHSGSTQSVESGIHNPCAGAMDSGLAGKSPRPRTGKAS